MAELCDRHVFVIFGATGDLTRRKLLPSLYRVVTENGVADRTAILGVSPTAMDDAAFRALAWEALEEAGFEDVDAHAWCDERLFFETIAREATDYAPLADRIRAIERDLDMPGNRAFYLALPPVAFPGVIENLGRAGLNESGGWSRLVIEKPFGKDLRTAQELNYLVHRHFDEKQVYRIDHYLGKETVQNLLTFRFANPLFETSWNRDRLEAVEITVAEDLGVGTRAGYYESAGVLRDMVQNHLTQLMTLVAMEAPSGFNADAIRNEKVQVLESISGIDPHHVIYGQYTAGEINGESVVGYLDEQGVAEGSKAPTFVGVRIDIDTWRWQGVPFFLRTGKRLPERTTQIAVTYKPAPVCIFHGKADACPISPNVVVLTLQPDEGFEVRFEVKSPGTGGVESKAMYFDYEEEFQQLPDAYQTLLFDVMTGDQTLFVRGDEVEASWRLWEPILQLDDHPVYPYAAGTWGPAATNESLALWTDEWTMR